jgi:hypothetical protein
MYRKSKYTPFLLCLFVFLALLFSPLYPSFCLAKKVTLGWDANSEPDLEGYVVYRNVGSPGPPYKHLKPKVVMTGLKKETAYYVAVTAYDLQGNESNFSPDLCIEIVDELAQACSQSVSPSTGSSKSSGGGGSGGSSVGCFISSASLKTSASTMEPVFISQQQETIVLILLLIVAAKFILSKITSHKTT